MFDDTPKKICSQCKIIKELYEFSKNKNTKDGLLWVCKSCNADYYKNNREERLNYSREREARKRKLRQESGGTHKVKKTEEEKKRDRAKYNAERYRNKREEILSQQSEYARNNPGKIQAKCNNRRAKKLSAEGTHTKNEMQEQFTRQKGKCYWCKAKLIHPFTKEGKGEKPNWDHIIPLTRGGRNSLDNLVWTCEHCNKSKGNKLPSEWRGNNGKLL